LEANELKYFNTSVEGLDEVLRGGFLLPKSDRGLIVLIKGRPGAGKTSLALQIAEGACHWKDDVKPKTSGVYYFTCEQLKKDIESRFSEISTGKGIRKGTLHFFAWDDYLKSRKDQIQNELEQPLEPKSPLLAWIDSVIVNISKFRKNQIPKLLILDGLNMLDVKERRLVEEHDLIELLRKSCNVAIIIHDTVTKGYAAIDFMADMIIELFGEKTEYPPHYYINQLSIIKSRYQSSALGWHQYKIEKNGISVFPSIHFRASRLNAMIHRLDFSTKPIAEHLAKSKESDINDKEANQSNIQDFVSHMLGPGNLKKGSCTVILGSRRTMKTLLTLDFLRTEGHESGNGSLLLSLLDNQGTIIEQSRIICNLRCIKDKPCQDHLECFQNMFLLHFRPGCIHPDEFFDALEERLRTGIEYPTQNIARLAFWDLTQLEDRFPLLHNEPLFLPLLIDHLKNSPYPNSNEPRKITSIFMGAPNTQLGKMASAMADNVLFCWHDIPKATSSLRMGKGVAIYVDRIEGQPGKQRVFFIEEPKTAASSQLELKENINADDLLYAESMIEEIQKLQGLPMRKSLV
jgi:KaiC/GvpD/RAD55 family RecA-like ATPase